MTPTISISSEAGSAAWTTCRSAVVSTATSGLIADGIATSPAQAEQQSLHRHQPRLYILRTARRPKHKPELSVVRRERERRGLWPLGAQDHVPRRGARTRRPQDK